MGDEKYERTVTLPVRIVEGLPQPFYGPTWPRLKDGYIANLVLPVDAFVDPSDETLMTAPLGTELLAAGTTLLAAVSDQAVGEGFITLGEQFVSPLPHSRFLPFTLLEPLRIQLRGTKKARLEPCRCEVPSLKKAFDSVNETYTRISEHHEPYRRSHTGNVFEKVLYLRETREQRELWYPLDDLRHSLEMILEQRFRQQQEESKRA